MPTTTSFTGCTLELVLPHHDPNEGRTIINDNFRCIEETVLFSLTGSSTGNTVVQQGSNIVVTGGVGVPPLYIVNLDNDIVLNSISATTISASTYYVGDVPLSSVTSGLTYTNSTPTTATVGGIGAGSTFSSSTMTEMWDMLLYPYQAPTFNAFAINGQSTTIEVGDKVPAGSILFTWSTTNSSNVAINSIIIQDITNVLTLGSSLSNDGSESLSLPADVIKNSATSNQWRINATNTESGGFIKNFNVNWRHKRYWGTHSSFTLPNNSEILNADGAGVGSGNEFATSRVQTKNGIDGSGDYIFFAWPTSFGNPTFNVNGLPNTAWTKIGDTISFTNSKGFIEDYDIWISDTAQNSPITLFNIS